MPHLSLFALVTRLLNRLRYGLPERYSPYEALRQREARRHQRETRTAFHLFKKHL